jgi:hypothetical protein
MKKAFLTLLIYLICLNMYAQEKSDLYGYWKMEYNSEKPTFFNLKKPNENNLDSGDWGRFIEFKEDGTYDETASAPCGMDDNRYHYTGKWKYDPQTRTIDLSEIKVLNDRPNIYNHYKVLSSGKIQIVSVDNDQITLKIVKAWEKVSSKK